MVNEEELQIFQSRLAAEFDSWERNLHVELPFMEFVEAAPTVTVDPTFELTHFCSQQVISQQRPHTQVCTRLEEQPFAPDAVRQFMPPSRLVLLCDTFALKDISQSKC